MASSREAEEIILIACNWSSSFIFVMSEFAFVGIFLKSLFISFLLLCSYSTVEGAIGGKFALLTKKIV